MFDMKIIDVAIGVVFFFTFAAIICSTIRELVESVLSTKARMLETALRELLDDPKPRAGAEMQSALVQFYQHPLIDSLFHGDYTASKLDQNRLLSGFAGIWRYLFGNRNLPAYIPAAHFSGALFEMVERAAAPKSATAGAAANSNESDNERFERLRAAAAKLLDPAKTTEASPQDEKHEVAQEKVRLSPRLARALLWAFDNADGDIAKARSNVERWYDNSMERVTGWYKRRTQDWLLAIGLVVAFTFNLNAIDVIQRLYDDDALREAAVAAAMKANAAQAANGPSSTVAGGQPQPPTEEPPPAKLAGAGRTAKPAYSPTSHASTSEAGSGSGSVSEAEAQARVDRAMKELQSIGYPVGWTDRQWSDFQKLAAAPQHDASWASKISRHVAGWLLTAIAMTLGAPFWFDLLSKLAPLRTSLKPAEKASGKENAPQTDALLVAREALARAEGASGRAEAALRTVHAAQAELQGAGAPMPRAAE